MTEDHKMTDNQVRGTFIWLHGDVNDETLKMTF